MPSRLIQASFVAVGFGAAAALMVCEIPFAAKVGIPVGLFFGTVYYLRDPVHRYVRLAMTCVLAAVAAAGVPTVRGLLSLRERGLDAAFELNQYFPWPAAALGLGFLVLGALALLYDFKSREELPHMRALRERFESTPDRRGAFVRAHELANKVDRTPEETRELTELVSQHILPEARHVPGWEAWIVARNRKEGG